MESEPFDFSRVPDVEKKVAEEAKERLLSARQTRDLLWTPLAKRVLAAGVMASPLAAEAAPSPPTLSIDGGSRYSATPSDMRLTDLMRFIEETLSKEESYNASNLGMEVLRLAVAAPPSSELSDIFDQPYFRAAVFVYDPFVKGVPRPSLDSIKRIFLDTSVDLTELEPLFVIDLTEEQKEVVAHFAIPQAIPGLGFLSADPHYPLCDLRGLSDAIEKMNGNRHQIPLPGSSSTAMRQWMVEVAAALRIRLLVINLASNIAKTAPACLIKYRMEALELDMRTRGHVITANMITSLNPFEFPPPAVGRGGGGDEAMITAAATTDLFDDDEDPLYLVFGEAGPIYVFLDYRYGEKRYLLLGRDSSRTELPPDASVRSLKHLGPPQPSNDDLHTIIGLQHVAFMAKYIPSTIYDPGMARAVTDGGETDLILPSRGTIIFEHPLPGIDIEKAALEVASRYMHDFVAAIDLNRKDDITPTVARMRAAFFAMYEDKIEEALKSDIAESIEFFSATSESLRVLTAFEVQFIGSPWTK